MGHRSTARSAGVRLGGLGSGLDEEDEGSGCRYWRGVADTLSEVVKVVAVTWYVLSVFSMCEKQGNRKSGGKEMKNERGRGV